MGHSEKYSFTSGRLTLPTFHQRHRFRHSGGLGDGQGWVLTQFRSFLQVHPSHDKLMVFWEAHRKAGKRAREQHLDILED